MMSFKNNTCFLVSFLIIISLTACAPEDPNEVIVNPTQELGQTDVPTGTERNISNNSTIESLLLGTPSHISKVFSGDFAVEADVHVPNVKKADILLAEYMHFDEEKLLSIFYKGKKPQRNLTSYDDTIMYRDDSSYLNINKGFIAYVTQDFEYVKFPTDSFVAASDIFSANRGFGDVYTQENLGFMTRSKALEAVSSVLAELSLDIIDDVEIYAIDSLTMQTQQEEKIQREIDKQKNAGISPIQNPTEGYQTKSAFTQEDDFYILFFKIAQNNIPITQKSYMIQANERALNGSIARVSFSQKGIIHLYFNGIYQQQGVSESPSMLIPVEEALQKAYKKHNSIISTDKATVTAIDLEYVPVPYNSNYDEVKLTPAWCLTLAYKRNKTSNKPLKDGKQDSQSSVSHRVIFINAVTGEEIQ